MRYCVLMIVFGLSISGLFDFILSLGKTAMFVSIQSQLFGLMHQPDMRCTGECLH